MTVKLRKTVFVLVPWRGGSTSWVKRIGDIADSACDIGCSLAGCGGLPSIFAKQEGIERFKSRGRGASLNGESVQVVP